MLQVVYFGLAHRDVVNISDQSGVALHHNIIRRCSPFDGRTRTNISHTLETNLLCPGSPAEAQQPDKTGAVLVSDITS